MELTEIPIEQLIPYARNARTHSDDQVAQIAASIKEFGFTNPVLIDGSGVIIAGHGRVLAARKLDLLSVPVIKLDYLTENQKRAYIIADNKLALNAGWDDEMLRLEIESLDADGFDLDFLGFSNEELSALLNSEESTEGESGTESAPVSLSDRFMIPPFSVMNAREGWWQNRKRAWIALGIKSELGRGDAAGGAAPGGGLMPAMKQAGHVPGSKTVRGNSAGRPMND